MQIFDIDELRKIFGIRNNVNNIDNDSSKYNSITLLLLESSEFNENDCKRRIPIIERLNIVY